MPRQKVERVMKNANDSRRAVLTASVVASVMMLVFGIAYHVLAGRQGVCSDMEPLDPNALASFPLQIGDWVGQDIPLDSALGKATGADAYINRRYVTANGAESVTLFVGCGTNVNAIMSHRPQGCYLAAGWTRITDHPVELTLGDGSTLPCIIYEFCRPALATEKLTVLHYCRADGQYFDEVMKVLAYGQRGLQTIGYAAQVQIVFSSQTLTDDSGIRIVSDFAIDSGGLIAGLLDGLDTAEVKGGIAMESCME